MKIFIVLVFLLTEFVIAKPSVCEDCLKFWLLMKLILKNLKLGLIKNINQLSNLLINNLSHLLPKFVLTQGNYMRLLTGFIKADITELI